MFKEKEIKEIELEDMLEIRTQTLESLENLEVEAKEEEIEEYFSDPFYFEEDYAQHFINHEKFQKGLEEAMELAGFYTGLVNSGMKISLVDDLVALKYSAEKSEAIVKINAEAQEKIAKEKSALFIEHTS